MGAAKGENPLELGSPRQAQSRGAAFRKEDMRHAPFCLIAFMLVACGSSSLSGASDRKSSDEKKDAGSGAGSEDETIVDAKASAPVTGSYLVACGEAPAADAATSLAAGQSWYGCGAFDAKGAKVEKKIETVTLAFDDAPTEKPALVAANATSKYTVLASVATARLARITGATAKIAGEAAEKKASVGVEPTSVITEGSTSVTTGTGTSGGDASSDPAKDCREGEAYNARASVCERVVAVHRWHFAPNGEDVPAPLEVLFFAADNPPSADVLPLYVDKGVAFQAMATTKCGPPAIADRFPAGACDLIGEALTDGTNAIFDIVRPDAGFNRRVYHLPNFAAEQEKDGWTVQTQRLRLASDPITVRGMDLLIYLWSSADGRTHALGTETEPFYPGTLAQNGFVRIGPLGYGAK